MRTFVLYLLSAFLFSAIFTACQEDYSPKPRGYFRIEFPDKKYKMTQTGCPFDFEIPAYATLEKDREKDAKPCWLNLDFPQFNARLHLSYFDINKNVSFQQLSEDARTFAFNHTVKATAIEQKRINKEDRRIFGVQYLIRGNTASNDQFFVSDSTHHYLRGALYFNEKPHLDSIQPVLDFINADIEHIIQTIHWK
ncbi:gliding motility-associated lipoprotein GldD [Sphingobacterium spiritivorum]|uniref:Gliding motility-associated lipoprotein GldD n=1 Tax=Sphingobacterium spiritivorum TaxID=258 RepID=A0A380B9D0_SPHSI|nr:gliding motility lipoprotein GldD [Sphingobacterium spiritivorum]SUI97180.1 gliding motility-associated lipoprotein GldD [Sphingobacterium spiritivorum]